MYYTLICTFILNRGLALTTNKFQNILKKISTYIENTRSIVFKVSQSKRMNMQQ